MVLSLQFVSLVRMKVVWHVTGVVNSPFRRQPITNRKA